MIDVKELRLGSWVKYDNRFHQIEAIWSYAVNVVYVAGGIPLEKLYPIRLTSEILEQSGFRLLSITTNGKTVKQWKMNPNDSFYLYGYKAFYAPSVMPELEYLHQLQNLYHALTGEELQVNIHDKTQTT